MSVHISHPYQLSSFQRTLESKSARVDPSVRWDDEGGRASAGAET